MTTRSEDVLLASLTDVDALEQVARIGLPLESIPTEELRPIVGWALEVFFDSGRKQAPSREMLNERWGQILEDEDIEILDEDLEIDTIESAIDGLKDHHAHYEWQQFIKTASMAMANAGPTEKVSALTEVTNSLFALTSSLQDQSSILTVKEGIQDAVGRYEERLHEPGVIRGMTFGMDLVDQHTFGIHPGELAVLAAGPKVGKSMATVRIALHEWATRGRHVCLFTLENTKEMTFDRFVCFLLGLDPRGWQRGQLEQEAADKAREFIKEKMPQMPGSFHVLEMPRGRRAPEMMVRQARLLGAQSVIVDQLTHVEHPDPGRKPRHELFNENVHDFADLAKSTRDPISILLAHQINRAGVEAARKKDYLEMENLAESAGVERAASWVFGLHQSAMERANEAAKFQIMAARREDVNNWQISWDHTSPVWEATHEIILGAGADEE